MEDLINRLKAFAKERDWEQFHSPKNLAMALNVKVSEIDKLKEEIGDAMIYLTKFADKCGIDLVDAAKDNLKMNEKKYTA